MNILVTGATGFIGRHLVKKLLEDESNRVFCLVRNRRRAEQYLSPKTILIFSDITSFEALSAAIKERMDIVLHCAGFVSNRDKEKLREINVLGTENICRLAWERRVSKLVYASSVAVISGNKEIPLRDDLPFAATNVYGQAKIAAEKRVIAYRKKGLPCVIIRPCMVYGEDEPHLSHFLRFLFRFRLVPVLNGGNNRLHLVYVGNVVSSFIFALNGDKRLLESSFIIADKEALTYAEAVRIMAEGLGAGKPFNIPKRFSFLFTRLPWVGRRIRFTLKDRVYSTERLESLGFRHPYAARTSLFDSFRSCEKQGTN